MTAAGPTTQFASTFTGAFLIPLLVIITASVLGLLVKTGWKILHQLDRQDRILAQQDVTLALVRAEVLPNGGSSMRDGVNRVEARQLKTAKALKKHLKVAAGKQVEFDEALELMRQLHADAHPVG